MALFFLAYWALGSVAFLRIPGWPRTLRWVLSLLVALWTTGALRAMQ